jgi:hypothetical protein
MTDDEKIVAEMGAELSVHPPIEIVLTATGALHLAGILQLTLRHPMIGTSTRATAVAIIEQLRTYFADAPATLKVIQRGDDPSQDRPWRGGPES